MGRVVVVGIGSPFGADRIGWEVAEELKRNEALHAFPAGSVAVVLCDRPGAGLLEHMRGADAAILVDAVQGGGEPGAVLRIEGDAIGEGQAPLSSHGLGLAAALALGRSLGELPKHLVLIGVDIGAEQEQEAGAWQRAAVAAAQALVLREIETVLHELKSLNQNPFSPQRRGGAKDSFDNS